MPNSTQMVFVVQNFVPTFRGCRFPYEHLRDVLHISTDTYRCLLSSTGEKSSLYFPAIITNFEITFFGWFFYKVKYKIFVFWAWGPKFWSRHCPSTQKNYLSISTSTHPKIYLSTTCAVFPWKKYLSTWNT